MGRNVKPTVFVSSDYRYVCDTCEPLKSAIKSGSVEWTGFRRGLYPGVELAGEELEGLRLLAYWDAKKNQDWSLGFHRNEGLEIGFVENGSTGFSSDGRSKKYARLTNDYVAVTKPWQEHSVGEGGVGACKMYFAIIDFGVRRPNQEWKWPAWIILSESDKSFFSKYMQNTQATVFKSTPEMKRAFSKIGGILSSPNMFDFSAIALMLNCVLLELLNVFRGEGSGLSDSSPNENVVKCFLDQLPAYCAEPWTLGTMAEDCGLKPTRFAYYCKRLANATPMEILNDTRLERAKKMILASAGELPLTQIALECGFSSSQYFSTKFKEKFGVPPREFKA